MINANRIVPVEKIDLISLYGLILQLVPDNEDLAALAADDVEGDFTFNEASGLMIADQPLKSCNFTVDSGVLYFVPDYHYEGFKINSVDAEVMGDVDPDGHSLYRASLKSGAVAVMKLGF